MASLIKRLLVVIVTVTFCQAHDHEDNWLIEVGHNWGAHEYIDDTGYLKGFSMDLIHGVCNSGGLKCKTVWDRYVNCWESPRGQHPAGGKGLHGEWYDACFGYVQTVERVHVFDFGLAYLKSGKVNFYVKQGNPDSFDGNNIVNKRIGFIIGWASDEKCLARQSDITGSILKKYQIIYANNAEELVKMLNDGEIDAAFTPHETLDSYPVQAIRIEKQCEIGGSSIMTKKGSKFIKVWNDAFKAFKANGGFRELCEKAENDHGKQGTIDCLIED